MNEKIEKFLSERFEEKDGAIVNPGNMGDTKQFARELGHFLYQLHRLDTEGAPTPSFGNAFAGADLPFFEAEITDLLLNFKKLVPVEFLHEKFDKAVKKPWTKPAVWVHGNFCAQNLRVKNGKLTNVLAFDKSVKADPACDLAIGWALFDGKARKIFFAASEADEQTIDRARIWALKNALKSYYSDDIDELIQSRDGLTEILKDYGYSGGVDNYDGTQDPADPEEVVKGFL